MTGANIVNIGFMEKTPEKILSEIKELVKEIRSKTELLENKYIELESSLSGDSQEDVVMKPDTDIVAMSVPEMAVTGAPVEIDLDIDVPDAYEAEPAEAVAPLVELLPETDSAPAADYAPASDGILYAGKAFSGFPRQDDEQKPVVLDAMAEKQAWRRDIPGTEVKDVRSAISLNDRILFIRSLFGGDAVLFQDTLDRINSMESLERAVEWLMEGFPGWNFESDTVYRFMMAVRRKLR